MTLPLGDRVELAVLRLFGLERLEDATRENWPWHYAWDDILQDSETGEIDFSIIHKPKDTPRPYFPDFARDDAAAVKLAERMGRWCAGFHIQQPQSDSEGWTVCGNWGDYSAPTLGAALLDALVGSELP